MYFMSIFLKCSWLHCWHTNIAILYTFYGFVFCNSFFITLQGENPKKPGNPHNVRLYSIASTRYGDSFDGRTASLCVRRAVYYDPETGKEDPSKNGVCSNFLCDSKPGDKVLITGKIKEILLKLALICHPNSDHLNKLVGNEQWQWNFIDLVIKICHKSKTVLLTLGVSVT